MATITHLKEENGILTPVDITDDLAPDGLEGTVADVIHWIETEPDIDAIEDTSFRVLDSDGEHSILWAVTP